MDKLRTKLESILKLEIQKQDLLNKNNLVQKGMPICQPRQKRNNPQRNHFDKLLDDSNEISKKQAEIFNSIQNKIIGKGFESVKGFCIRKNFPVKRFEEETYLDLEKEHIEILLKQNEAKK